MYHLFVSGMFMQPALITLDFFQAEKECDGKTLQLPSYSFSSNKGFTYVSLL